MENDTKKYNIILAINVKCCIKRKKKIVKHRNSCNIQCPISFVDSHDVFLVLIKHCKKIYKKLVVVI